MRLTVLGSGTVSPHPTRVNAGHLIETADVRLLMDCGNGVVHRMATLGLPWQDITHIAFTHFHYDHIGDFPNLISAWRWGQLPARAAPLTVIGPPGIADWLRRFSDVVGDWVVKPESFTVAVIELVPGNAVELGTRNVTLSCHPVPHNEESVAYSVSSGRGRVVYTGDTGYDAALADWAAGCDVLLAECSLPAAMAIAEHLTPESAAALAARAKPGRLVLTHFFPPVEHEDIPSLVRAQWPGPLVLAHDGTVVDVQE